MMMTQKPLNNFERFEPIYIIQAFDHLLQLFQNEELSYIGVNQADLFKDICELPMHLFYRNPESCMDELDGLFYLTKFLDSYKKGERIVYQLDQKRLLTCIRKLLSINSEGPMDTSNFIQRLAFVVFSLTDVVSYDFHDNNWQILLKRFENIQMKLESALNNATNFYNSLSNDSKNFIISHLLKPSSSKPIHGTFSDHTIPAAFDFISILPNELILKIFTNLNGKDLLSCAGVSKQWRGYAQNQILWKQICKLDAVFDNPFLPPFYKPRPQNSENSWLIGFGNKYNKEHATEMPPRFYNRSSIMYEPAMDYFGIRWHNKMFENENTKLISQWLRSQSIKRNWTQAKPTNIAEIFVHDDGAITCMDVKAGLIASGSENMSLACYSMTEGKIKFYKKKAHGGGIWSIGISDQGDFIASGATDRTVRIWKAEDGSLLKIFVGHTNIVRTLKIMGNRIISGSRDKTLRIWSLDNPRSMVLDHEFDGVRHIEIGNGMIISGGYEGMIKIWDQETGEFLHSLEGHTSRITKLQFDSTKSLLVTGSADCSIRIWDLKDFKQIACIIGKTKIINLLMDKDHIYSAHSDFTIKIWSWPKTKLLHEIPNQSKEIINMFLTPFNGLVTNDEKGNVKIWNTKNGECLSTFYLNNDIVNSRIWQLDGSSTQLIIGTNRCDSSLIIALDFDYPNP